MGSRIAVMFKIITKRFCFTCPSPITHQSLVYLWIMWGGRVRITDGRLCRHGDVGQKDVGNIDTGYRHFVEVSKTGEETGSIKDHLEGSNKDLYPINKTWSINTLLYNVGI